MCKPRWAGPRALPPFSMSGVDPRMDPVPAVGEHTHAILAALGHGEERIAELRRTGAV
jgi:itaconate CoA-transferase